MDALHKRYGTAHALRGVSFDVAPGEIVALLGPNGAGKSSIMRILTGYLPPTSGTLHVGGRDVRLHPREVRAHTGYLPETNPLYEDMLVFDHLRFMARMRAIPRAQHTERIHTVARECGILEVLHLTVRTLSRGYRQRVGIACALLHNPELLILDEPTAGLDPNQIREIRELILNRSHHQTILLSTHILQEVEALADRVLLLHHGTLVADDTLDALTRDHLRLHLEVTEPPADLEDTLAQVPGVEHVERQGERFTLTARQDCRAELYALCRDRNLELRELSRATPSLEDLFATLTRDAA